MSKNKQQIKVTVGMPVYNGEQFLERSINSLLNQSYNDFQLIISDNASTDETSGICQKYARKNKRIHYIRQLKHITAPENFQFCLNVAESTYFMWAAHDDWWDPHFIESMVRILDSNHSAVVAFSKIQHVDESGIVFRCYPNIINIQPPGSKHSIIDYVFTKSFTRFLYHKLIDGKVNIIYGLFRRNILVEANIIKKWGTFGWGADLLMVAQVLRFGEVEFCAQQLWSKTENPNSAGSLPKRKAFPPLSRSMRGVMQTYFSYLKYVWGVWAVQGSLQNCSNINVCLRLFFTAYEFIRMSFGFLLDVVHAIIRRIKNDL